MSLLPSASVENVCSLLASISLPKADSIEPLDSSTGAYHSIYILTYNDSKGHPALKQKTDGKHRLVLRISGGELPGFKTMNEVAMIKWVRNHTSIPAPAIVAFDHTNDNPLGHEYSITEYVSGQPLSQVYEQVKDPESLVNQIIDCLVELYDKPFQHVGGLRIGKDDEFHPGPMAEWHFWTTKDSSIWSDPLSMNAVGPFRDCTEYFVANMRMAKLAIDLHPKLQGLRILPIDKLIDIMEESSISIEKERKPRFVLAHRDLHFGNIMFDVEEQKMTGIIDWELAAVLPYHLWNPGNFLWTGREGEQADQDKVRYNAIFERLCRERKLDRLLNNEYTSLEQETMQRVTTLLRTLVNAHLSGWQAGRASEYEEELVHIINSVMKGTS